MSFLQHLSTARDAYSGEDRVGATIRRHIERLELYLLVSPAARQMASVGLYVQ